MSDTAQKSCPKCSTVTEAMAVECDQCGYTFRFGIGVTPEGAGAPAVVADNLITRRGWAARVLCLLGAIALAACVWVVLGFGASILDKLDRLVLQKPAAVPLETFQPTPTPEPTRPAPPSRARLPQPANPVLVPGPQPGQTAPAVAERKSNPERTKIPEHKSPPA